eukprot:1311057-Amphidinium_carterae.2
MDWYKYEKQRKLKHLNYYYLTCVMFLTAISERILMARCATETKSHDLQVSGTMECQAQVNSTNCWMFALPSHYVQGT